MGKAVTLAAVYTNFYIVIANFVTSDLIDKVSELGRMWLGGAHERIGAHCGALPADNVWIRLIRDSIAFSREHWRTSRDIAALFCRPSRAPSARVLALARDLRQHRQDRRGQLCRSS